MDNIQAESDSEKTQPNPTVDEVDQQLKNQVDIKIKNLNTYIDTMNETLEVIRGALEKDLKISLQFFKKVNKTSQKLDGDLKKVEPPTLSNLQVYLYNMYCKLERDFIT